jgi:hypothetical protein
MKSVKLGMGIAAVAIAVLAMSGPAMAQVDNTTGTMDGNAHDLRTRLGIDQVCLPCHAPHNGANADEGPL